MSIDEGIWGRYKDGIDRGEERERESQVRVKGELGRVRVSLEGESASWAQLGSCARARARRVCQHRGLTED